MPALSFLGMRADGGDKPKAASLEYVGRNKCAGQAEVPQAKTGHCNDVGRHLGDSDAAPCSF